MRSGQSEWTDGRTEEEREAEEREKWKNYEYRVFKLLASRGDEGVHYCPDWDEMAISEQTVEIEACLCARCSMCQQHRNKNREMIEGSNGIHICGECVDLMNEMIQEKRKEDEKEEKETENV